MTPPPSPPQPPPVTAILHETFSRLPPPISDEDLPLLQLSVLLKTNKNESSGRPKTRAPHAYSHLRDDDYLAPPPTETSNAGSYSFCEEPPAGKKRRHSNVDSNTSLELGTKRPRHQTVFSSVPAPIHTSETEVETFENTPRKPDLLALEDNAENLKERMERWHAEIDHHDMTGLPTFCPIGELRSDASYRMREDFSRKNDSDGGNSDQSGTTPFVTPTARKTPTTRD